MMNLYQPNNRARTARRRLLFATVFFLAVYLIDSISGGMIRAAMRATASFLWDEGSATVNAIASTGFFSSRSALESRIKNLTADVERLTEQGAENSVLRDENTKLRSLVNIASKVPGITAPVMSSFRTSPYGTFTVGAGSADSVVAGDLVVSPSGFVIGRVSDVSAHTALVREVFAPNMTVDGVIGKAAVSVEGRGGGNAYARLPHGIAVSEGDPVTSQVFAGRPIGIVGATQSDSASAYTDVYIGLPVSLESLTFIYIEK